MMKQIILTLLLASGQIIAYADFISDQLDTIPNWQIYYGDKLIIQGNSIGQIEYLVDTIKFDSKVETLKIFYNYDAINPGQRKIEIWENTKLLDEVTSAESVLKVNIIKLLTQRTKNRIIKLKIYYTDNSLKKKNLIGMPIFDFTHRPTFYYGPQ